VQAEVNSKLFNIDLKKKLNKRETVIFGATLVMWCFGVFNLFVKPNNQAIADAQQEIIKLEEERKQLAPPKDAKKKVSRVRVASKNKALIKRQWIGDREVIEKSIDELAQPIHLSGVKVINSQISDFKTEKAVTKKSAVLMLSGNFTAVGRYIEYLENLPVPLVIETISIVVDTNNSNNVVANIDGGFYASK
jgi:hypothetical protein